MYCEVVRRVELTRVLPGLARRRLEAQRRWWSRASISKREGPLPGTCATAASTRLTHFPHAISTINSRARDTPAAEVGAATSTSSGSLTAAATTAPRRGQGLDAFDAAEFEVVALRFVAVRMPTGTRFGGAALQAAAPAHVPLLQTAAAMTLGGRGCVYLSSEPPRCWRVPRTRNQMSVCAT
jgi:hypothetical protein